MSACFPTPSCSALPSSFICLIEQWLFCFTSALCCHENIAICFVIITASIWPCTHYSLVQLSYVLCFPQENPPEVLWLCHVRLDSSPKCGMVKVCCHGVDHGYCVSFVLLTFVFTLPPALTSREIHPWRYPFFTCDFLIIFHLLKLYSVLPKNDQPFHFYDRIGFKEYFHLHLLQE